MKDSRIPGSQDSSDMLKHYKELNVWEKPYARFMIRMVIIVACIVPFTSCGYRFSGGERLPQGIESLYIQLLDNKTTEPGIDVVMTSELKNEFIQKYQGALVDREVAEAILSGAVVGIQTETVARRGALTALERGVSMTIDLTLKTFGNERIWFAKGIGWPLP